MSIGQLSWISAGVALSLGRDAHTLGQRGRWKEAGGGADAEAFLRCLAAEIFSGPAYFRFSLTHLYYNKY